MAHRQSQVRCQTKSSCSNSSSASASPSNVSLLNFTLYGAPAPRSVHRTSAVSAKARPRRRIIKPIPPPPATPVNICDYDDPIDLKLDLSSLDLDDDVNDGYNLQSVSVNTSKHVKNSCDIEGDASLKFNCCQSAEMNDHQYIASNSGRSFLSERDLLSQTCSEFDESSQGFGDMLPGNDSCRSNSSSYITLSEYSISYSASVSSNDMELTPERYVSADKKIEIEDRPVVGFSKNCLTTCMNNSVSMKNHEIENLYDNDKEIHFLKNNSAVSDEILPDPILNTLTKNEKYKINELNQNTNLFYTDVRVENSEVKPREVPYNRTESSYIQSDKAIKLYNKTESSNIQIDKTVKPYEVPYNRTESKYAQSDNSEKGSPEFYGYYMLNNDCIGLSKEWSVEDEDPYAGVLCYDRENSKKKYRNIPADVVNPEFRQRELRNSSATNSSFGEKENDSVKNGKYDELSDEIIIDTQGINEENSRLKILTNAKTSTTLTDAMTQQITPSNNTPKSSNRSHSATVQSAPQTRSRVPSGVTCSCNSGRETKLLIEHLESGYFPDMSLPDIPMTAADIMEAVLYARQLVRVLERALHKALSFSENLSKSDSRRSCFTTNDSNKKRCRSLSPKMLRYCCPVESPQSKDFNLQNRGNVSDIKCVSGSCTNLHLGETEDKGPHKYDYMMKYKKYYPRVTADELQKQKDLLKPPTERVFQQTISQVYDTADILKNIICRRRKVIEPPDGFVSDANRSVSNWSLDSSPRDYKV